MWLICLFHGHKWCPLTKFVEECDRCPATRVIRIIPHPFDVV